MSTLLVDPSVRVTAVTPVDEPPGVQAGDQVMMRMRVVDVATVPGVLGSRTFWLVTLMPEGVALKVEDRTVYIEAKMVPAKAILEVVV